MEVQPYSSRYVSQRYSEDKHGPHHDILPQYGVSRQRPNRPGEYRHPGAQDRRFICTQCRKTFAATYGTVFYRLRTAGDLVALIMTLLAHGCPVQAIVVAFEFDERTVAAWGARAGRQGQAVQAHRRATAGPRPGAGRRDTHQETRGHCLDGARHDGLHPVVARGRGRAQRDMTLIRRLIERVRACALHRPLLLCTDGLCSYIRAMRETFRDPVWPGTQGRPRLRPWRNVCIAQVVKRYAPRRVVDVERRMVDGTPGSRARAPHAATLQRECI